MHRWFDYIAKLYAYRFIPSLGFDGENNEGLAYWSYGVGLVIRQVDAARQIAGINYYQHPWLKNTARFPLYCAPAMGYAMPFGDCGKPNHSMRGPVNASFTAKLASEADDAEALWYAGYAGTDDFQAKSPATLPQSIFYSHLGMAFFNTFLPDARENVAVAFRSGKFFAGHQHNDLNTFNINAYGDKLAIDGGYYDWCGSKHHQAYTIETLAHNTILFNGQGQKGCKPDCDGYILGFLDCDDFGYVAGDAATSGVYGDDLKRFDRQLLFIKPDYVLAYDTLEAVSPATFSWLIHSHTEQAIEHHADGSFRIERPLARLTGRLFADTPIRLHCGESYTELPVDGYSVDLAPNRQMEWTLTGENASPLQSMHYLAAMHIEKSDWPQKPETWELKPLGDGGYAIRNHDFIAVFAGSAEFAEAYGLKTDGRAAAILLDGGKLRSACAVNATYLQYKGKRLTSSLQKGNLTVYKPIMQELDWKLSLDGKAISCEGYSFKYANGREVYHLTGIVDCDQNKRLNIRCNPPRKGGLLGKIIGKKQTGMVNLRLSNEQRNRGVSFKADESYTIPVLPGKSIISFSSEMPFGDIELKSALIIPAECEMKEVGWNPPAGAVLHEAEILESQVSYEGKSAKVTERPSASNGKASVGWDCDGQSGTWAINIPETGEYQLYICTASTNYKLIIRELFMDGKAFSSKWSACSWGTTGGFGYTERDWRWVAVPGTIHLEAGLHRLGMAVYLGSSNLDAFAFVKKP